MALLTTRLNLIGSIRDITQTGEPDLMQAATLCELAGVDGIAVQVRRDRRQIRGRDLALLRQIIRTRLTVEIPPVEEIVEKVLELKPWMVTFTADQTEPSSPPDAIDFGNVPVDFGDLSARAKGLGVRSCFFIESNEASIKGAVKARADAVMLNCRVYAEAGNINDAQIELDRIDHAAQVAAKSGLSVLAGRGLNFRNLPPLSELGNIDEFIIGRSFVARSCLVGIERTVQELKALTSSRATA